MHDGDETMTCIAALKTGEGVLLGGDSRTTFAGTAMNVSQPKVFEVGDFLIGCSGSRRHAELLRYHCDLESLTIDGDLDRFMARDFSNAVRKVFKEAGVVGEDSETSKVEIFAGAAIIVVRNEIYVLAGNFSCSRHDEYAAVGSGMDFALAILFAVTDKPPRARLSLALSTAAHLAEGVRAPFTILPEESR